MRVAILYAYLAPPGCDPGPERTAGFLEIWWPAIWGCMAAACPRDVITKEVPTKVTTAEK